MCNSLHEIGDTDSNSKFGKEPESNEEAIKRLHAEANDKHLLGRLKRKIDKEAT